MNRVKLPLPPQEATKTILKNLPSRRMRDVLEKRFGLKSSQKQTLEAIGAEYKITRERVRQIEADALKNLSRPESLSEVRPVLAAMAEHLNYHGEVMAENHLLSTLAESRHYPHVSLLLEVGADFHKIPETTHHHPRWSTNPTSAQKVEQILKEVVDDLEKEKKNLTREELVSLLEKSAKNVLGRNSFEPHVLESYLATSRAIGQNPYGEYGLISWPTISPRGIKDKAYVSLYKAGKPMHFLEIAEVINKTGWSKRKAHPQTVHNELIKDGRFVLVGRGLYALKEWGYQPGVVRDVLVSIIKEAGKPLSKEEIIKRVLEKRFVKVPTILLNLQAKNLFQKNGEGEYTLV